MSGKPKRTAYICYSSWHSARCHYLLGECTCRTLWGVREYWGIELLCFTSEVSGHCTQAMHAWHVAKTRFVTLLLTKVVNSLEKSFMVTENGAVCPTSTQLLWLLYA